MNSVTLAATRGASPAGATVDFREVRARMDLPRTRILLERGCDKDVVRQLIEERLRDGHPCGDRSSRDFESAAELMAAYLLRVAAAAPSVDQWHTSRLNLSATRPPLSYGVAGCNVRLISGSDANVSFVDLRQLKCRGTGQDE